MVCVLHTHTVAGVAVSTQRDGLLPINQWSMQFTNRIAYHAYEGIALDLAERERLVAHLGDKLVFILRNHGLLTCGRSVSEAFKLMFNLERSCKAQLAIQASGAPIAAPAAGVPEKPRRNMAVLTMRWHARSGRTSNGPRSSACWRGPIRITGRNNTC